MPHLSRTFLVNYLLEYRLQWGQPDKLSLLKSVIVDEEPENLCNGSEIGELEYLKADSPRILISIIQNDWPYSGRHLHSS